MSVSIGKEWGSRNSDIAMCGFSGCCGMFSNWWVKEDGGQVRKSPICACWGRALIVVLSPVSQRMSVPVPPEQSWAHIVNRGDSFAFLAAG